MSKTDRLPLLNAPATIRIREWADNRLGAVYSALYSFWSARHAAATWGKQAFWLRRDAYSVILFNDTAKSVVVNDFTSSPDQLLDIILNEQTERGTNFAEALQAGQAVMEDNWNTERFEISLFIVVLLYPSLPIYRTPIMIFLSDGECSLPETAIQDLCRSAIRHGYVCALLINGSLTGH